MFTLKPLGGATGEHEEGRHGERNDSVYPLWRQLRCLGFGQPDLPRLQEGKVKVKVKFVLEQATTAQMRSRGTTLLFL